MFCNVIYQGKARLRQLSLALHRGGRGAEDCGECLRNQKGESPLLK